MRGKNGTVVSIYEEMLTRPMNDGWALKLINARQGLTRVQVPLYMKFVP
jgi:hypothetical protein